MSEFEEQFETCEFMGCEEGKCKCHTLPTIVPTLVTSPTFLIISSMSPDGPSPLQRIIDTKYDDDNEKKALKLLPLHWVQSCLQCKEEDLADRCTHIGHEPQHFPRLGSQERLDRLMSSEKIQSFDEAIHASQDIRK